MLGCEIHSEPSVVGRKSRSVIDHAFAKRYRGAWLNLHGTLERQFMPSVAKWYEGCLRDMLPYAREGVNPAKIKLPKKWTDKLKAACRPHILASLIEGARLLNQTLAVRSKKAASLVATGMEDDLDNDDILMHLPDRVRDGAAAELNTIMSRPYWGAVSQHTLDIVRHTIQESLDDMSSTPDIQKRLKRRLGPEGNQFRIRTLARSEVTGALNAGQHREALSLHEEGIVSHATWQSTYDANTRTTHVEADGQTIKLPDEQFTVGGYKTPYPGWWGLPARERVNCRCSQVLEPTAMEPMNLDEFGFIPDASTMLDKGVENPTPEPISDRWERSEDPRVPHGVSSEQRLQLLALSETQRSKRTYDEVNRYRESMRNVQQEMEDVRRPIARRRSLKDDGKVNGWLSRINALTASISGDDGSEINQDEADAALAEVERLKENIDTERMTQRSRAWRMIGPQKPSERTRWVFNAKRQDEETDDDGNVLVPLAIAGAGLFVTAVIAKVLTGDDEPPIEIDVDIDDVYREYYDPEEDTLVVNDATRPEVIAHLVMHKLEKANPLLLKAARGFLFSRVGMEVGKWIDDELRDDEIGMHDKFAAVVGNDKKLARYIGKFYSNATEVLAMGVMLIYRDPVEFAKNDPEFFRFVVSILRGTLLKEMEAGTA